MTLPKASRLHLPGISTPIYRAGQTLLYILSFILSRHVIALAGSAWKSRASQRVLFILSDGISAPCLMSSGQPLLCNSHGALCKTIGEERYALNALLLLALPSELTFQALFALPRFAERKRTF